jgi:predicted DNA-binding transcriptional regulator AlpA
MPELWTMKKLCEYLRISRQSVYRGIKAGRIPKPLSQKVTGSPRWDADEIKKRVIKV